MINLLIFSKDRACQLDFLLRSIVEFVPNLFDVNILYISSSSEFEKGYKVLINKYLAQPPITFVREENFQNNTIELLFHNDYEYVALSTDDTVFFQEVPHSFEKLEPYLRDIGAFSFRYGLNTIVQDYHEGTCQPPLSEYNDEGEFISWKPRLYHSLTNYGYITGLNMHVYNKELLEDLSNKFIFRSTNELESKLFHFRSLFPDLIRSYKHSKAVNIPINNLSKITRAGEYYPYSVRFLNHEFLNGKRLSLDSLNEVDIVGAHQEIPLQLEEA